MITLGLIGTIIIALLVVAFIVWLIEKAPVNATIKQIIQGIIILLVIIYVIQVLIGGVSLLA